MHNQLGLQVHGCIICRKTCDTVRHLAGSKAASTTAGKTEVRDRSQLVFGCNLPHWQLFPHPSPLHAQLCDSHFRGYLRAKSLIGCVVLCNNKKNKASLGMEWQSTLNVGWMPVR
jgi:hypothetical protein